MWQNYLFISIKSVLDYLTQLNQLINDPLFKNDSQWNGKNQIIYLIPGFMAGDYEFLPLIWWLKKHNLKIYTSGLQINAFCPFTTALKQGQRIIKIYKATNQKLIVVGHSLGGLLAKFLGVKYPFAIKHVVAIGSPLHDPYKNTNPVVRDVFIAMRNFEKIFGKCLIEGLDCPCGFKKVVAQKLPKGIEFTSIFSKDDEIVHWQGAKDFYAKNIKINRLGHASLIVNKKVFQILAQILTTKSPV